jgi:hypothetical protein
MTAAWLLIRRLADQLAIYLPVLLMGALALTKLIIFCANFQSKLLHPKAS